MRRRELLSSVLSGFARAIPFQGRADVPEQTCARQLQEQFPTMAAEREHLSWRAEELFSHLQSFACTIAAENKHRTQILSLVCTMRAPLAALDMTTQLMLSSPGQDLSEQFRSSLEMNARSCQRLAELINEIFILERSRQEVS